MFSSPVLGTLESINYPNGSFPGSGGAGGQELEEHESLVKCVINPKMQVIYAKNVYCSRVANLRAVNAADGRWWWRHGAPPGRL